MNCCTSKLAIDKSCKAKKSSIMWLYSDKYLLLLMLAWWSVLVPIEKNSSELKGSRLSSLSHVCQTFSIWCFPGKVIWLWSNNWHSGFFTIKTFQITALVDWVNLGFIQFWLKILGHNLRMVIKLYPDISSITLWIPEKIIEDAAVVKFQNKS